MATEGRANPPTCISNPHARDLNGSIWLRDRWCEQLPIAWGILGSPRVNVVQMKRLIVKVPR